MTAPARSLRLVGQAEYRDEAEALLDGARGRRAGRARPRPLRHHDLPRWLWRETLVVNLDSRADKAWRLDTRGGGVTLYPSVWRDGGCESHFVVWRGVLIWCDRFTSGNVEPSYDPDIEKRVLARMDATIPPTAEAMADAIDEIVWDVNRAANRLVGKGLARSWKQDGTWYFVRTDGEDEG